MHRSRLLALLAPCAAAVLLCSAPRAAERAQLPEPVLRAANAEITPAALAAPIRFLASDALEGRGTASRGDDIAVRYLAAELEVAGYRPGANGRWLQTVPVAGIRTHAPEQWSFSTAHGTVTLKWYQDYIAGAGVPQEQTTIRDAELVFVGYGIQAPEYQWDDFKGVNLHGKVLVMMNNDPDWDPKLFEGARRLYYGRWSYKYESAARQGAAGAIIIHTAPSAGYPWQVVQSSWSGEQFQLPPRAGESQLPLKAWATQAAVRHLVETAGYDLDRLERAARARDFRPVPLGIRTSITTHNEVAHVQTANVAGVLPGSDPKLAREVVILSAHHDHFGIGKPDASGDRIYHGAVDNASGCSQVLAIARAIAALSQRPRRSVLILFVAAEEQGLLGSAYYAAHPTFPAGRIAADINFDGGNIWGRTRDVTSIGLGKSNLDDIVRAVASLQGRAVVPDAFPDRGYYYRSDQFSFAKIGVPGVYLNPGVDFVGRPAGWGRAQHEQWEATHYHQPSDKFEDSWRFDGMVQDAQLGFWVAWLIAQADTLPSWKPGDEFESTRRRAIAESKHPPLAQR